MEFSPDFENKASESEKRSQQEQAPDKAKESLRNKSFHEFVKYMKTTIAAGIMAAGVHGQQVQANAAKPDQPRTENQHVKVSEKPAEASVSNRDIAVDYVEKNLPETLKKDRKKRVIKQLTEILNTYGADPVNNIYYSDKDNQEKLEPTKEQSMSIEGFEELNISSEKLKQLWSEDNYPDGLIEGEVKSVTYTDSTYEQANNSRTYREADFDRQKEQLRFYRPQRFTSPNYLPSDKIMALDAVFAHEVSHGGDWVGNDDLSHAQRIEFLHDVHETITESENLAFVLDVSNMNEVKDFYNVSPEKRLRVIQEGWANIGELYLSKPAELQEEYPSLYELADKWLTIEDDDFDPEKAQIQRLQLHGEIVDG
jgi:hypothetical protein